MNSLSKKCAVFSCKGLGDGLLSLVLSQNLKVNGFEVFTFHPHLSSLSHWFPGHHIQPFPSLHALASFDRFFIFYEKSLHMNEILNECLTQYRSKTLVINPIATANKDYPFWDECRFNGGNSFLANLITYCQTVLHLKEVNASNGIVPPKNSIFRRYPKRVVIHPMSAKEEKNWPKMKFKALACLLRAKGYEPVFIMSPLEREHWLDSDPPLFTSLSDVATFVYESGSFIGNDSGIGHLASSLGLPTLTICRNAQTARFWRPSWSEGRIITPNERIPNIKFFRLRDRYWKNLISVKQVLTLFESLI